MSGFLKNMDLIVPIDLGLWGIWPICCERVWRAELDSINGHFVAIFWVDVNSSGSFLMNAWKSPSWSNRSFSVSGIAFLQMSTGLMVGSCGVSSCVIWVGDGGGGVETKSIIFSSTTGFVVFTYFGLPCFAPASTNRLNYVSTDILFVAASFMMSIAVANSSSSSSNLERIRLRFPFPFS